jgi:hypothetical protein
MRLVKILQPFVQFGTFVLATYISLTRITDYKHHPTDILAGSGTKACSLLVLGARSLLNLSIYKTRYTAVSHQSPDWLFLSISGRSPNVIVMTESNLLKTLTSITVLGIVVAITVAIFLLNLRQYPSIFFQRIWTEDEVSFIVQKS